MTADQIARDLRQEAAKLLTLARILEGKPPRKRTVRKA
jgi:hypothetical protein